MTEALKTLFENHEIRAIEQNGEVWFPLVDLAGAWGVDRTTPRHLIVRNPEVFEGMAIVGDVTSQTEDRVNERGLYLLMGKISASRLKNKDAKIAIIRFQRWVPELIQKYRKKEIVQVPAAPDPVSASLLRNAGYADILIERYKWSREQANAFAFSRVQEETKVIIQDKPAIQHGETGWYNPTQLGLECGLTPEQFNMWLYNKGFVYRFGTVWRLQPKGEPHGREYTFEAPSGHREPRIAWRVSILEASGLVRHPEQAALPGARV